MNSESNLNDTIKWGLSTGAKFLWGTSIVFSMFGLLGILGEASGTPVVGALLWLYRAISLGLSAVVNILELSFNRMELRDVLKNPTVSDVIMVLLSGMAYFYDGYTNTAGLSLFILGTADIFHVPFTKLLIPLFFGLLIAVGPEPMYNQSVKMKYINRSSYRAQTPKAYQKSVTPSQGYYQNLPKTQPKQGGPSLSLKEYLKKKYPENFD